MNVTYILVTVKPNINRFFIILRPLSISINFHFIELNKKKLNLGNP